MHFRVVKSSAGSGKTYNLVRNYLLLVLGKRDLNYFARILAITFTNKATNEMKERIIRSLKEVAEDKTKAAPLIKDLCGKLELEKHELQDRASRVLTQLIHHYADFNVSTIDRFVTRVIKTFSFELGLPGSMEIELDRDRILKKSIDALFNRISDDEVLEDLLYSFAYDKFTEDKSIYIDKDLFDLSKEVINVEEGRYFQLLRDFNPSDAKEVMKKLTTRMKTIEGDLSTQAARIMKLLNDNGLGVDELRGGKKGIYLILDKLSAGDLADISTTNRAVAEDGKWYSSKCGKSEQTILESLSDQLTTMWKDLIENFDEQIGHYRFCQMLRPRLYLMSLINEVSKQIAEFKSANDVLELDDFNRLIGRLVDESPVPYIYERTGDRFFHYFIDEFQDTSVIQWYNILPLVENALSEGHENLVVGDVKQAIYRWRGGDASQMSRLPKLQFSDRDNPDIELREETLDRAHVEDFLDSNWRSSRAVVDFVNGLFKVLREKHPAELAEAYKGHEQIVKSNELEGSVEVLFLEDSEDDVLRNEAVLKSVKAFVEKGYQYADLAILCRKKSECANMAQLLIKEDVPVISAESLKLGASEKVRFVVNWIMYLQKENSRNEIYLILAYLEHAGLMQEYGVSCAQWMQAFDQEQSLSSILRKLDFDVSINELRSMSLQEAVIHLSGLFFSDRGSDPFLSTFIDEVSDFMERFGNDHAEFFQWWEEIGQQRDVEMPGEGSGLNIMTIHKAKGLEFPVVILPYMNHRIDAGKKNLWVETKGRDSDILPVAWLPVKKDLTETNYAPEYEEEMRKSFLDAVNLMYVAFTRAADHVYILSSSKLSKSNDRAEQNLLWNCFSLSDYRGDESSLYFRSGSLAQVKIKKEIEVQPLLELQTGHAPWRKRIALKYRSDEGLLQHDVNMEMEFGKLLHAIMAEVHQLADLDKVLSRYVYRGLIEEEGVKKLKKYILDTLEQKEISPYYANDVADVFNERDILDNDGSVYRPDRMVRGEDQMVLIDYKTGQESAAHEEQIRNYTRVLENMSHANISAYLLYFGTAKVKKVI